MRRSFIQCSLLSALLCGASLAASAAETTINGFASFVGGMALNQQELPNGCDTVYYADPGYAKLPIGEPGTDCHGDLDTPSTQAQQP